MGHKNNNEYRGIVIFAKLDSINMVVLGILAVICGIIGILGSVVPGLPGPPVSWVGLLLAFLAKGVNGAGEPMSLTFLLIWLAVTVVVSVMDWVVPGMFTRVTGGHKSAGVGAVVGLIAGMFIPPVGMIFGSLLGAFIAEFYIEDQGAWASFKSSIGAFLGFMFGTGIKLISSAMMMYYIVVYL